ncbi:MAG TPA: nitroreductase family deazaflavin-dependent oxidoreductase [Blastocatellia bacterium]|jgi:deazaflavin-dependent oxidoreductase (nitroreductase family)
MRRLTDFNPKCGLTRLALRLPIWLYHARLGWLLGERFLLLTHTGRMTRLPHQNVLEVIRHDRATGAFIVASGWGERADWFRNIQETPEAVITVKNRRVEVSAVHLSIREAESELLDYARRHPIVFRYLAGLIMGSQANGIEETARSMSQSIPLVAFRPR